MLTTIVPNFNHAKFLPESLSSLIAQSRPTDELIVIDDNSTDGSVDIISSFLPRHPNARLIRNARNQGCNANLNNGLRIARGDFIHFAAADDLFDSGLYAKGVAMLEKYREAAIFSARSEVIDGAGHKLHQATPRPRYPLAEPGYISPPMAAQNLMREDSWFMGNTAIYRTSLLREQGGFPEELFSFADGFMCRLLSLKYGACFTPEILGSWRRLEHGMASSAIANLGVASAYIAATEVKMLAPGTAFPAEYVRRWRGRQHFGIRRQLIARQRSNPSADLPTSIWRRLRDGAHVAWLALRWRPWDLGRYIPRRFASFFATKNCR
jgi:glycosyltransferase involved in cell wall biosynthesis